MLDRRRKDRRRDPDGQDSRSRPDRSAPVIHFLTRRLALIATVTLVLNAVLLIGPGASDAGIGVRAQEVTPEAAMPVLTGTQGFKTYANFGAVDAATLLAAPMGVNIFQLELAPGASVAYPPGDPGMGAHLVESGTLTLRKFSMDIMVTRVATHSAQEPMPVETLPAGSETQLGPGDGFLFPPLAAGEFRNDGTEPVVLAISVVFPMGDLAESDAAAPTP